MSLLIKGHGHRSGSQGTGIDHRIDILVATQHDHEVAYHGGLALFVKVNDVLLRQVIEGHLHHTHRALHNLVARSDNRSGLLSSGDLALMCRTLKVVGDGLGSLEEKYGATTQFGQHLARVADILSIRSYVIEPFEGGSRASVQPVSTREAIEIIDELARKIAGERLAAVPVDGTQVIN